MTCTVRDCSTLLKKNKH